MAVGEEDVAAIVSALGDGMRTVRDDDAEVSGHFQVVVLRWGVLGSCGIAVSVVEFLMDSIIDRMQGFLRVLTLGILALGACAENPPLQSLPFQRWVETLSPDGKLAISPPKERAVAGQFSLSPGNITTEITNAYRYGDNVVVFGWSGHSNGIVTIIDVTSGKEKLELLVEERLGIISPTGALVYAHWFVPGALERSDSA